MFFWGLWIPGSDWLGVMSPGSDWFEVMYPGSDWLLCLLSAGVGRTGTFMALDRLMQHLREHEYADVLGMVSEMRSHRLSMVQTEVRGRRPGHSQHAH